ncbi:hypothetical protein LUZ61_014978 [Rhynchospora tenuis]|uniref:Uncharacterized protein n=1 Tax=Rhynchospora tenuis TaxID=198213 RepID=A0AAD5WCF5_9POAL|nr:hypothetical protein LUZ61_014978 [Rhynchospora tenuis]
MVGHKGETCVVGCKVLPICDVVSAGSNSCESSDAGDQKIEQIEGRKSETRRGVSRMKELIRRVAAAKAHTVGSKARKVLHLQSRDSTKDPDDRRSSNSSKISLMWDVRSCSSTSSVYTNRAEQLLVKNLSNLHSNLSNHSSNLKTSEPDQASKLTDTESTECVRMGQWIMTDSDFVVLEL